MIASTARYCMLFTNLFKYQEKAKMSEKARHNVVRYSQGFEKLSHPGFDGMIIVKKLSNCISLRHAG